MKAIRSRLAGESGAVLLLALGFITFVGVLAVSVGRYAVTDLRATVSLQDLRAGQFAADGVVDAAIARVRLDSSQANSPGCFTATLNAQELRVDCSVTAPDLVTFSAYRTAFPSNPPVLVAEAKYNRSATPVTVEVRKWSVNR
jgi:hypothetical protein